MRDDFLILCGQARSILENILDPKMKKYATKQAKEWIKVYDKLIVKKP